MTTNKAFDVDLPCPRCGLRLLVGLRFVDATGKHQHTRYLCTQWECEWTGWTVPDD